MANVPTSLSKAILYFDYILTIGIEVERFWGRRLSPLACGFFFNRYVPLLAHIAIIYQFFGPQVASVSSPLVVNCEASGRVIASSNIPT